MQITINRAVLFSVIYLLGKLICVHIGLLQYPLLFFVFQLYVFCLYQNGTPLNINSAG
jgi:membrane protein YqaA with SNARE-associated domain